MEKIFLFYRRALNFLSRIYWLSILSRSPIKAFRFLIQSSRNAHSQFEFTLKGMRMKFRATDTNVMEEIFIDREYDFLEEYLASIDEPIVVDVGAHIGAFSIWTLIKNRSAKIISIEADPSTFNILSENKLSISLSIPDVIWKTYNLLAWNGSDEHVIFSQIGQSMSHRVDPDGNISVKTIGFSDVLSLPAIGNNNIDVLKIDIEGSEEALLCENPELLTRVRCLVIELHPYLCNTEDVIKVINQYFTKVIEIKNRASSKPLLYCQK